MKSFEELLAGQDLYTSEKDRGDLEKMSETQREEILYRRYCALKAHEEKKQLQGMASSSAVEKVQQEPRPSFEECNFIFTKKELVDNIFKPFFSSFRGCFVRARVNEKYCVCKIMGTEQVKPYPLRNRNNENTDIALTLDTGTKLCKEVDVTSLSSRGIEEKEFNEFVKVFKIKSLIPLQKKYKNVSELMRRELSGEERNEMVAARERANPKKKSRAAQKIELILKRDAAAEANDKEAAQNYQKLLQELENEEWDKKRRSDEQERIAAKKRLEMQNDE